MHKCDIVSRIYRHIFNVTLKSRLGSNNHQESDRGLDPRDPRGDLMT